MEGLAVMGFVFGMVGVVALVRLEKLTKTLKQKGILEEDYKVSFRTFLFCSFFFLFISWSSYLLLFKRFSNLWFIRKFIRE